MLFPFRNYPGRFNGYNLSRDLKISRHPNKRDVTKLTMFQIIFYNFNCLLGSIIPFTLNYFKICI